uniref:S-locus cysteine-rich-like protein n=1 Tax=Leavenworthia alabamica TaxID=310722 RepID=R9SAD7_LEAAL|nr:S-locus cysteine-rich-like protein [Leavenworthia alabamica]
MAKSVRLISFIIYLMINMLIFAVNPKPHSSQVPPIPDPGKHRRCFLVRSKTLTSTCVKQKCYKHCIEERYVDGKCESSPKGNLCWCSIKCLKLIV